VGVPRGTDDPQGPIGRERAGSPAGHPDRGSWGLSFSSSGHPHGPPHPAQAANRRGQPRTVVGGNPNSRTLPPPGGLGHQRQPDQLGQIPPAGQRHHRQQHVCHPHPTTPAVPLPHQPIRPSGPAAADTPTLWAQHTGTPRAGQLPSAQGTFDPGRVRLYHQHRCSAPHQPRPPWFSSPKTGGRRQVHHRRDLQHPTPTGQPNLWAAPAGSSPWLSRQDHFITTDPDVQHLAQPARQEVELGPPGLLRRLSPPSESHQRDRTHPSSRRPTSPACTLPRVPVTNPTAGAFGCAEVGPSPSGGCA
jgi:hypothetical protein